MKKILLIVILIPLFCHSQNSKHKVLGIDLDLDWYTLTNYSQLTYFLADEEYKDDAYVMIDFEYYHPNVNPQFMNIGFTEMLLGFPKGMQTKLDVLQPEILLARIYYNDIATYKLKTDKDINKVLTLLQQQFGKADLNTVTDGVYLYKWNGVYYDAILTSRVDELTTTFVYSKK